MGEDSCRKFVGLNPCVVYLMEIWTFFHIDLL